MFYVEPFAGEVQGGFIWGVRAAMESSVLRTTPVVQSAIDRSVEVIQRFAIAPTSRDFFPIRETMGFMLAPLEEAQKRGTLVRVGGEMFPTQVRLIPNFLEQTGFKSTPDVMRGMSGLYSAANRGAGVGSITLTVDQPDRLVLTETTPYDCAFHEGLFTGVARHFRERWTHTQTACRHQGAAACVHELTRS